jgi:hypothetical protein
MKMNAGDAPKESAETNKVPEQFQGFLKEINEFFKMIVELVGGMDKDKSTQTAAKDSTPESPTVTDNGRKTLETQPQQLAEVPNQSTKEAPLWGAPEKPEVPNQSTPQAPLWGAPEKPEVPNQSTPQAPLWGAPEYEDRNKSQAEKTSPTYESTKVRPYENGGNEIQGEKPKDQSNNLNLKELVGNLGNLNLSNKIIVPVESNVTVAQATPSSSPAPRTPPSGNALW